jgi:hypothetical protein
MKLLFIFALLLLSLASHASLESKTFYFDGTQGPVQFSLQAEETHTEYRYEQRRTICYRTEVFYETVCTGHPRPSCYARPVTRTVAYSCIQTVRIPYEVKDYDVDASVELEVAALPGVQLGESFKVTLDGDRLSVTAMSSGRRNFVLLKKEEITSSTNGSMKFLTASYRASVMDAWPVLAALSIAEIGIRNPILSFNLGPIADLEMIGLHLHVKKSPVIGGHTVLFDRELAENEISLTADGDSTLAEVNVERLGLELRNGRYSLTAKAFFKLQDSLLNRSQFKTTEASRTLLFKDR